LNRTNIEHAVIGLLIMGLVWLGFALLGVVNGQWIGAAAGVAFFFGREYTQAEREVAKALGVSLVALRWYAGLDFRTWSRDAVFDLLFPLIACLAAALLLPHLVVLLPLLL
jgi:hypothetical protein